MDNVLNKIVADLRQLPYCVMIAGENGSTRRPLPFTATVTVYKLQGNKDMYTLLSLTLLPHYGSYHTFAYIHIF